MWLIVPTSTGKTVRRDSGVTCHTPPNWLVGLVRSFPTLPAHPGFFLPAPHFSIRKQNMIGYIRVDTHSHERRFARVMLQSFVFEMKRHK